MENQYRSLSRVARPNLWMHWQVVTTSTITSWRDDEPTERPMVTKIIFSRSLWIQPKNRCYFGSKNPYVSAVFATALLGLVSVRFPATAANQWQLVPCRRDELGVANSNVTSEVTDQTCPHSCARAGARGEQGALSASS